VSRRSLETKAEASAKAGVFFSFPILSASSIQDLGSNILLVSGITELLEAARRTSARSVNAIMTAAYWMIGRRIVEYEQGGKARAEYGEALLERLSADLSNRYGRGFGVDNLQRFRSFYLAYPPNLIYATRSRRSGLSQGDKKYATASRWHLLPARKGLSPVDSSRKDEERWRSKRKRPGEEAGEK